ncbi:PepSY domain-containing protein [Alteromonas gilva]|uniref:PepSY domain-containing protein n=1 Tax=Alteromonas gilva TaxID=2987522 RepID=A0ABT5L0Y4_9ALTE|nr:PepSY domain-containing protein [Alteromonas gilva]MDC8830685.1 PepSY domain-containing protein [Alteromonas gilva]
MKQRVLFSFWHKWLALLVAVQVLIWLGTGLYFNFTEGSTETVREVRQPVSHGGDVASVTLFPLAQLKAPAPRKVELIWSLGNPYYVLWYNEPAHRYFPLQRRVYDARTGQPWQIGASQVASIAQRAYRNATDTVMSQPVLLSPPFSDINKQQNPLWRVNVDDALNTSIYLDALTGHVVTFVNDDTRLKVLMFTLHFMDYAGTGSFNHWIIIVFAIATCLLSFSGAYLLFCRHVLARSATAEKAPLAEHTLTIRDNQGDTHSLTFTQHLNDSLYHALLAHNVSLPSECHGAGTCGKCQIVTDTSLPVTPVESAHLSEQAINQGVRLACQHTCRQCHAIDIPMAMPRSNG